MIKVIISEFDTLLVVTFWLRCFQSCVWVLMKSMASKKRSLIEFEYAGYSLGIGEFFGYYTKFQILLVF